MPARMQRLCYSAVLTLAVMALMLSACGLPAGLPARNPDATLQVTQTLEANLPVVTEGTPVPEEAETSPALTPPASDHPLPAELPLTQYRLAADLDYSANILVVDEQVTYTNRTSKPLSEILMIAYAKTLIGEGFQLNGVHDEAGIDTTNYRWENESLIFTLPAPLGPGESWAIRLAYTLMLPEKAGLIGRSGMQTNFGDWYPYIPPYDEEKGWIVHPPGSVGEHLVYDIADFNVSLSIRNPSEGLEVAASAIADKTDGHYFYNFKSARNFAWSVSPHYERLESESGPVKIQAFVFTRHHEAGIAALETVRKSVELFSDLYAPYPHPSLTMVEADFFDGMEYDGLFFLGAEYFDAYSGSPRGYLTALSAHETAHQWWYGLVGNDPAMEPWLDEALCAYSERLFYEHYFPELGGWWWAFRVEPFQPTGAVDSTIYEYGAFRPYVNAVYLRGAMFLRDVRLEIGDDDFLAFLAGYAQSHAHNIVTQEDFFSTLSGFTSKDISQIKTKYFKP